MSRTLEDAVAIYEKYAIDAKQEELNETYRYYTQLAAWLSILKAAKFEYDEAWRILTSPTPDVTDNDKKRAVIILDVFRDSLGRME